MVDGAALSAKQQSAANNKSFNDPNSTKVSRLVQYRVLFTHPKNVVCHFIQIVLRRLPPTLTSEQFLEIVAPLPDHDYYRFCKADFRYA